MSGQRQKVAQEKNEQAQTPKTAQEDKTPEKKIIISFLSYRSKGRSPLSGSFLFSFIPFINLCFDPI
jgi:hypothetical protein